MSATNGHIPEGGERASIALIRKHNRHEVLLPRLSKKAGKDQYVQVRPIRKVDYSLMQPPQPAEADRWPDELEARQAAAQKWFESLPLQQRLERKGMISDIPVKLGLLAVTEPAPTESWLRDLGDDLDILAHEIKVFSEITPADEPPEKPAADAQEAPETEAPGPVEVSA